MTIPGTAIWDLTYRKLAAESPGLANHLTLPAAAGLVRALLDPILTSRACGIWDPERAAWYDQVHKG